MHGAGELNILIIELIFSGIATFFAIMLWSLTRDPAWMFIVIGIVLRFGDVVFQTMDRFGIVTVIDFRVFGLSVFWVLIRSIPWLCFSLGFFIMVRSKRI